MADVNASAPVCNNHEGLLTCPHVTGFRWQVSSPLQTHVGASWKVRKSERQILFTTVLSLTQGNVDGWMDRQRDLWVTFNNGANVWKEWLTSGNGRKSWRDKRPPGTSFWLIYEGTCEVGMRHGTLWKTWLPCVLLNWLKNQTNTFALPFWRKKYFKEQKNARKWMDSYIILSRILKIGKIKVKWWILIFIYCKPLSLHASEYVA